MPGDFSFFVPEENSGQRLDALVADRIPECSRSLAADLIRRGIIQAGGQVRKPGYRLQPGDHITGTIPAPEAVSFEPEPISIQILHEDNSLIVINKAPGLVVHPAPGHYTGTLVNAILHHCPDIGGIGGELRPGIVHRLDKDTSGVLVVAKNALTMAALSDQFKSRTVRKSYLALVHGVVKQDAGQICLGIGRHPLDRKKMSVSSRNPKPAETCWQVRERLPETTLMDVDLKTGRTHQIRVHFASIHHPLAGDPVYCSPKIAALHSAPVRSLLAPLTRQMLHARQIRFVHPETGNEMCFEAPVPEDMSAVISALREHGPATI